MKKWIITYESIQEAPHEYMYRLVKAMVSTNIHT